MSEVQSHQEAQIGSPRSFGVVFAVVFGIIALWPLIGGNGPRLWATVVAAAFALLAFVAPNVLQPMNRLWFKFGELLARIVSPIIMGIMFFLVFTPMAFVLRLLGKDLLSLKLNSEADTYWVKRDRKEREMGSMKNQF